MMPALSLDAKAAFESLVADGDWPAAFAQAKLIAIANPLDRDIRTWVGFTIAMEWGDDGREKVEALWPEAEPEGIFDGGLAELPSKAPAPPRSADVVELHPSDWRSDLQSLEMDFYTKWVPEVQRLVASGIASQEEILSFLDEAWEGGAKLFLEETSVERSLETEVDTTHESLLLSENPIPPTSLVPVTFSTLKAISPTVQASLDKRRPYDSAKEFVSRYFINEGFLSLYFWDKSFWYWNTQCYTKFPEPKMRDMIYTFLDSSLENRSRFSPVDHDFREVIKGLEAGLTLDAYPPTWLHTGEKAANVLMFKNGLVDILTGTRCKPDPRLWIHSTLSYEWDPSATCPTWLAFLESIFPGDPESRACVEEQLGYCMTEDIRFEKGFMWIGVPRSGKGTLTSVLEALVGSASYISLSTHTWVVGENSRQSLINKKVGCFPDVRLKPGKKYGASFDSGGLNHQSVELLLRVIAGDTISIKRMYEGIPWEGRLPMKIVWAGNQTPNLNDEQALPSRFVKLSFNVSFLGKEDITLKSRLLGELSGIANRCLSAYQRLLTRGRFVQPAASRELESSVITSSDTFSEFVITHYVPDPAGLVNKSAFRLKLCSWASSKGYDDLSRLTPKDVTRRLTSIPGFELVSTYRQMGAQRMYAGIRYKSKSEED